MEISKCYLKIFAVIIVNLYIVRRRFVYFLSLVMDILSSDLPPELATIPVLFPKPCCSTRPVERSLTVHIVEQPVKSVRFRYESERRIEPIFGKNSVKCKNKTYPKLWVCGGYEGPAKVQVSLVTEQTPYLQHPHRLLYDVEENTNGIYEFHVQLKKNNSFIDVKNLGIQRTLQKDVPKELTARKELGVDPFKNGFKHIDFYKTINLKAVRLCFSVSVYDKRTGEETELEPVVSNVIYDVKVLMNLSIKMLNPISDYHFGGNRLIILCERVTADMSVVFFEKEQGRIVWEAYAEVDFIHKQAAIVCFVPQYHLNKDAEVGVQLRMYSDLEEGYSNVIPFYYMSKYSDPEVIKNKRKKMLLPHLQTLERTWRATSNRLSGNTQENLPIAGPSGLSRSAYTQPDHLNNQSLFSNQSMSNDYASNMPFTNAQVQQIDDCYNSAMQISGNAATSMQSIADGKDFSPEYLNNTHAQQQTGPELALPRFSVFNKHNTYVPKD